MPTASKPLIYLRFLKFYNYTPTTCLHGRLLLHRLQETDEGTQVFCLQSIRLHGHGNLLRSQDDRAEEKERNHDPGRITHTLAATREGFFELQEFILFPSQTIRFYYEPNSDFQTFLERCLLPDTAHTPLPVHDLFPERYLTTVVLDQSIHAIQPSQPPLQFFLFFLGCSASHCGLRCRRVVLRVMLVDQIQQVLHLRIILRLRFLHVLLQHFFQFFYNATILPN